MQRMRIRWIVMVMVAALTLSGCGLSDSGDDGDDESLSAPTEAASNTDADITSGCWTASDRGASEEEGTSDVAHQQWSKAPEMTIDQNKTYRATMETSAGTVEVEFYPKDAPKTVNNFVCLARAGYFDNTPFHRIISGFVAQGGDPTGTGTGGPGYRFEDEPITKEYEKGTLAMANAGPNTNGSQFFICTADLKGKLGKNYTVFGKVVEGMDVVDALDKTPVQTSRSGEKSSPINPVTLNKVTITES
jgi:cyclophilin family peptidyl-prolyl cis-trans isomerase